MKKKKLINYITYFLVFGIILMSIGIFMVGKEIPYGNLVLSISSFIVYVSIIVLAIKV